MEGKMKISNLIDWKKRIPISVHHNKNPFLAVQDALDRARENFYSILELTPFPSEEFEDLMISPAIDIVEDEKNFKVEAELPGLGEDDVQLSIEDNALILRGEKKISRQDQDKNYVMREIGYGSYQRIIELPEEADTDKAKATFKKGMLWIEIPKREGSSKKSRKLQVEKVEGKSEEKPTEKIPSEE